MNASPSATARHTSPTTAGTIVSENGSGPENRPKWRPKPQMITANTYGR